MISKSTYINILLIIFILGSSIAGIVPKIQYETISLGTGYQHVFILMLILYIDQVFALIYYYTIEKRKEEKEENERKEENKEKEENEEEINNENKKKPPFKFYQSLPSIIFDFFGSSLAFFGLALLPGSICQMLRGALLIFTYILSVIFIKNVHNKNHYFGMFLTIIGLIIVGLAEGLKKKNDLKSIIFGICLTVIGQFFTALQFVYEENLTKKYECKITKIIGFQGIFGILLMIIVLPILDSINCGNGKSDFVRNVCTKDENGIWSLENFKFAMKQLKNSKKLIWLSLLYAIGDLGYNLTGITIGKEATSTARAIAENMKIILIWAFFLFPFNPIQYREKFNWIQLIGYLVLLFGNLIYHEIIVLFKYDSNDENIEKKSSEEFNLIDNDLDKNNKEGNSKTSETRTNDLGNDYNNLSDEYDVLISREKSK